MQEALSNTLQHAGAQAVEVQLRLIDQELQLTISDDGNGFAADVDRLQMGHFGLIGMRERAREIGAALDIISSPGAGTRVVVKLRVAGRGDSKK